MLLHILISVTTDADSISDQKIIDSLPTNHIEIRVEFKDKKTAWKSKNYITRRLFLDKFLKI